MVDNVLPDQSAIYEKIANQIYPGLVLFFLGDIGAGKTTKIREIMSYRSNTLVTSPTYQIVNIYDNSIVHMDMFRLGNSGIYNCCRHDADVDKYLVHNCENESSLLSKIDMDYFLSRFTVFIEWPACNYFYNLSSENDHIIVILSNQEVRIINNSNLVI